MVVTIANRNRNRNGNGTGNRDRPIDPGPHRYGYRYGYRYRSGYRYRYGYRSGYRLSLPLTVLVLTVSLRIAPCLHETPEHRAQPIGVGFCDPYFDVADPSVPMVTP